VRNAKLIFFFGLLLARPATARRVIGSANEIERCGLINLRLSVQLIV